MKMRAGWLIFLSVAVGNAGKGQAVELLRRIPDQHLHDQLPECPKPECEC